MRLFVLSPGSSDDTNQSSCNRPKRREAEQPASVEIVAAKAQNLLTPVAILTLLATSGYLCGRYEGSLDHQELRWPTSDNGTVGWTVNGSEVQINSADWMRPNGTLVLCQLAKVGK